MKLADTKTFKPPSTPSGTLDDQLCGNPCSVSFFAHIAKQVGRKPFALGLHLSGTLVDGWCTGEKRDVFTAAQQACDVIRKEGRADLIPAVLDYIGGKSDCAVLTRRQVEALQILAEAVKE
jgi:hypothetical protein